MITAMLDWAAPRGIGFSHVVSLGDMADVDFGDMLDYLAADRSHARHPALCRGHHPRPQIHVGGARCSPRQAGAGAEGRPLDRRRARGGLAYRHARRQRCGLRRRLPPRRHAARQADGRAVRCRRDPGADPRAEGRPACHPDQWRRRRRARHRRARSGRRPARRTGAGDDRAARRVLPATWSHGNPVDIIGDAPGERYAAALEALFADDGIDAFLVLNCPTALAVPEEAARAVIDTVATAPPGQAERPQHLHRLARRTIGRGGAPALQRRADRDLRHARGGGVRVPAPRQIPAQPGAVDGDPAGAPRSFRARCRSCARQRSRAPFAAADPGSMPRRSTAVLAAYGIPLPLARNAADAEEAAAAAAMIGFPVALKIRSPDITHKTDVGGVALDLRTRARCAQKRRRCCARVTRGATASAARRVSGAADGARPGRDRAARRPRRGRGFRAGRRVRPGRHCRRSRARQRRRVAAAQPALGARRR